MSLSRKPFRTAGPVVLLTAVMAVAGCTGGGSGAQDSAPSESADEATATQSAAALPLPTGTATSYPVAPSASPAALDPIGTKTKSKWTFSLTSVQSSVPGQVMVEGTLSNEDVNLFGGFAEPGYETDPDTGRGTYEFSAVTLRVDDDPAVYLPMRDEDGICECSSGRLAIDFREPYGVYTLMTAPENAATVDITVAGFGTFNDVPVSS